MTPVTSRVAAVMQSPAWLAASGDEAEAEETMEGEDNTLDEHANSNHGETGAGVSDMSHVPKLIRPYVTSGEDIGLIASLAASQEKIVRALQSSGVLKDNNDGGNSIVLDPGVAQAMQNFQDNSVGQNSQSPTISSGRATTGNLFGATEYSHLVLVLVLALVLALEHMVVVVLLPRLLLLLQLLLLLLLLLQLVNNLILRAVDMYKFGFSRPWRCITLS